MFTFGKKGFAYALDFWLLSSMQQDGSSMQSDAEGCYTRRRRWRRTLTQLHPPPQPTPCLSALSMVNADGKGVYSRRAVALALSISHRITTYGSSEDAYQALQNILGCDGFEALWRGQCQHLYTNSLAFITTLLSIFFFSLLLFILSFFLLSLFAKRVIHDSLSSSSSSYIQNI